MEPHDIEKLFLSVLEDSRQDNDAVRKVFSILVRATLDYRDQALASKGIVVTVDDVRKSLEWLIPALATGNMPESDDEIRLGLLSIWLQELRGGVFHVRSPQKNHC